MNDTKRIQLRLSEGVRARMAVDFRQSGCRSWDEFFENLLSKWEGQGTPSPESRVLRELRQQQPLLERAVARGEALQALAEATGENLQTVQTHLEQVSTQNQRLIGLLELAMGVGQETPPRAVSTPPPSAAPESRGAEVLRKIRNRQLS
ncbi:MAG: hypothetical protein IT578_04510 [Verrucomicrobiae bacterium]|nr:hypothetical protein [Verrucomicrobiae bacterium]